MFDGGTPKCLARSLIAALLAFPSAGGAVTRTISTPPRSPAISFRDALGLAKLAGAGAPALGIHQHDVPARQDRVRCLERLFVGVAAADGEHAAMRVDELHGPLEELRLRHEVDLAAQVYRDEEVVEER